MQHRSKNATSEVHKLELKHKLLCFIQRSSFCCVHLSTTNPRIVHNHALQSSTHLQMVRESSTAKLALMRCVCVCLNCDVLHSDTHAQGQDIVNSDAIALTDSDCLLQHSVSERLARTAASVTKLVVVTAATAAAVSAAAVSTLITAPCVQVAAEPARQPVTRHYTGKSLVLRRAGESSTSCNSPLAVLTAAVGCNCRCCNDSGTSLLLLLASAVVSSIEPSSLPCVPVLTAARCASLDQLVRIRLTKHSTAVVNTPQMMPTHSPLSFRSVLKVSTQPSTTPTHHKPAVIQCSAVQFSSVDSSVST
eukprot:11502-Heterococcus_DN1.PRE.3